MLTQTAIHIGDTIRNAVVFNANNWDGRSMNSDSLLQAVENLFTLLHQKETDYLLVGGIAILTYVEGRNTQDIDLIIATSSLERLPEIRIVDQDIHFARGDFQSLQVDLLLTENPLFDRIQRQYATTQSFAERTIPTATVEGLLLLKLYALPSIYRQGNFAKVGLYENDIATLLHYYRPDLDALLNELSAYLNDSDMNEVREIVGEIEQRIDRFQKGAS